MKHKTHTDAFRKSTIIAGYSLFAVLVASSLLATSIPLVFLLSNPLIDKTNVVLWSIGLLVGAFIPWLLTYFLGDRATYQKNKTSHHFNGVLFGFAAYWLLALFTYPVLWFYKGTTADVTSLPLALNVIPILATAAILTFVGITYSRNHKNKPSVLHHRPYQVALVAPLCITALLDVSPLNIPVDSVVISVVLLLVPAMIFLISYKALERPKTKRGIILAEAAVAFNVLAILYTFASPLVSFVPQPTLYTELFIVALCVMAWGLYLKSAARTE